MLGSVGFRIRRKSFFNVIKHGKSNGSALLGVVSNVCEPRRNSISVRNGLIPFVRLNIKFGPRLAKHRGICLGNTLLNFSRGRVSTVCSSVISFTRLRSFVSRGLGGCSDNVRIHLTFSITVGTRTSVLMLSRILTIKSRTFRHGYSAFFGRVRRGPSGAIVLIARSVSSMGGCYGGTVLVHSKRVIIDNSGSRITDRCALSGLGATTTESVSANCPINLGRAVPSIGMIPGSPLRTGRNTSFLFSIRCRYARSVSRFIITALCSLAHNKVACSANSQACPRRKTNGHALRFRVPVSVLGDKACHLCTDVHITSRRRPNGARVVTFTGIRGYYIFAIGSSRRRSCTLLGRVTVGVGLLSVRAGG